MGWNSWNAFASAVDEEKVMGSAKRIVDSGLARKGYRYINLDDGWAAKRRLPDGHLMIRTDKFPSAANKETPSFKPYTDKLHAMGLKAGIYSDMGRNTCAQAWSATDEDLPKGSVARARGRSARPYRAGHRAVFPRMGLRLHQGRWLRPARFRPEFSRK